jgi:hypothetical protein
MDTLAQFKENIFKNNIESDVLHQENTSLSSRAWRQQRPSLALAQNVASTNGTFIHISRCLR